jgi:hypothetical protein
MLGPVCTIIFIFSNGHFVLLYTAAIDEQKKTLAAAAAVATNSTATESSPVGGPQENDKIDKIYEPLGINIIPRDGSAISTDQPNENMEELNLMSPMRNGEESNGELNNLAMSPMRNGEEGNGDLNNLDLESENSPDGISIALNLGEREPKRLRTDSMLDIDLQK